MAKSAYDTDIARSHVCGHPWRPSCRWDLYRSHHDFVSSWPATICLANKKIHIYIIDMTALEKWLSEQQYKYKFILLLGLIHPRNDRGTLSVTRKCSQNYKLFMIFDRRLWGRQCKPTNWRNKIFFSASFHPWKDLEVFTCLITVDTKASEYQSTCTDQNFI